MCASASSFNSNLDDDLSDLDAAIAGAPKPPKSPKPNGVSSGATARAAQQPQPVAADDDLDDIGSETLIVPRAGKFARPAKYGEVIRIHLLEKGQAPWKKAFVHGQKGKGVFRCLNPKTSTDICCKSFGEAKLGYYTVALRYTNVTSDKGLFANGVKPEFELVPFKISTAGYESIMGLRNLEEEGDTIFSYDIQIGQAAVDILKGYTYKRMKSRILEIDPKAIAAAMVPWADGVKLSKAIARVVTPVELRALLSGVGDENLPDMEQD
jgi:hypothetical protein